MLRRLDHLVSHAEEAVIGLLLATASAVLFANVVARYVFNWGVPWAEELVRYEIVWMVFVGGSVAARKGIHIGVDILVNFAPAPLRRPVAMTVDSVSIAFCLLLVVFGGELIAQTRMFGQVTPALQVPMWMVQAAIPVGGGLMAVRFAQNLWHTWRGEDVGASVEFLG